MDIKQLKRKLREFKKVEDWIRFNYKSPSTMKKYVWNDYFSTKSFNELTVKYPLWKLVNFNEKELEEVFEEYFYSVYIEQCKESGLSLDSIYDINVLSVFGLNPGASIDDVKKKFREFAKKYHPDRGGDNDKMIEIIDAYHKLINKE